MNTTMNTVNQTFNWSRFTAALRKEVVENWRTILFTLLGIYGLLSMIMVLGNLVISDEILFNAEHMHYVVILVVLTFIICIAASLSFKKLTRKNGRVDMFTSPSSTLEKYLVNALIYVFGFIVAFFICAQLADLTRVAVLWYFRDRMFVPGPINFLTSLTDVASTVEHPEIGMQGLGWTVILGLIANAGLYLLGSVIWPRLSLLKTFAAIYAIEIALFILVAPFFAVFGDMQSFSQWFYDFIMGGKFSLTLIIILCVQIVLYFGLAWYLFKRKDVISLKWWK